MKHIVLIVTSLFLLSNCAPMSLKRSANNKLVDFSGFEGHKKRPVYNKKYITKAKRNIAENNYDEEEYGAEVDVDEVLEPASRNRMMYRDMLERDRARKQKTSPSKSYQDAVNADDGEYPALSQSRKRINNDGKSSDDMQKELAEIKKMLSDTKKDMAKYRCPMQKNKEADGDRAKQFGAPSLSNSIGVETP
jgi:hypothetical protein